MTRRCIRCGSPGVMHQRRICRPCRRRAQVARYHGHEHVRERQRRHQLARKYGITPEYRAKLFKKQKGLCAICQESRPLQVDHDHKSGRVRGLLCWACNVTLGKLSDNPALAVRAARYLRRRVTREGNR